MGPRPMYHPLGGEGCETSVEHGVPLWAEPDREYCWRRRSPSPTGGSYFVGAHELGPWVGEPKPEGKTPFWGNPSLDMTYLLSLCPLSLYLAIYDTYTHRKTAPLQHVKHSATLQEFFF